MIIGQWRSFIQTQNAYKDLNEFYKNLPALIQKQQLPSPIGKLNVQNLSAGPPGAQKATLKGLNFELSPGDGLCVLGHSGSGKSSLARLLVGVWIPQMGSVRLDGATLDQWDAETLGQHIGYLPQKIDLFDGTIGENISRFRANASPDVVIRAAKVAGFHEFILSLPEGYNTQLGSGGVILSVGQIQRVALARALYGDPCLVVLDEPNSNLDSEGDKALNAAISYMRHQNKTVIIISHRPTAMAAVNKVLVLKGGLQEKFGLRDQVFKTGEQTQPVGQIQANQANARVHQTLQNVPAA
jgi:ABC-type protease/lipase transport system fused ATPase/permease subunit